jgi:hypothetical protein
MVGLRWSAIHEGLAAPESSMANDANFLTPEDPAN